MQCGNFGVEVILIILRQGSLEVNPSVLIGSSWLDFAIWAVSKGHMLCIFVVESQQIQNKHSQSAIYLTTGTYYPSFL